MYHRECFKWACRSYTRSAWRSILSSQFALHHLVICKQFLNIEVMQNIRKSVDLIVVKVFCSSAHATWLWSMKITPWHVTSPLNRPTGRKTACDFTMHIILQLKEIAEAVAIGLRLLSYRSTVIFSRQVSSTGSNVTLLVYKISEKGGTIFIKSRTGKPGKKDPGCFLSHTKTLTFSKQEFWCRETMLMRARPLL